MPASSNMSCETRLLAGRIGLRGSWGDAAGLNDAKEEEEEEEEEEEDEGVAVASVWIMSGSATLVVQWSSFACSCQPC